MRILPFPARSPCAALALLAACAPMRNPPHDASFDRWLLPASPPARIDAGEVPRGALRFDAGVVPCVRVSEDDGLLEDVPGSFAEFEPERRLAGPVDFKEKDPSERARDGRIDRSRQASMPVDHLDPFMSLVALAMEVTGAGLKYLR